MTQWDPRDDDESSFSSWIDDGSDLGSPSGRFWAARVFFGCPVSPMLVLSPPLHRRVTADSVGLGQVKRNYRLLTIWLGCSGVLVVVGL